MSLIFERAALFEEVWAHPLTKLAAKYGLSDNGLRKVCLALEIPLPQRGHWARIAAGHMIPKPLLPPTKRQTSFVSHPGPAPKPSSLATEDEVWLKDKVEFEKTPANKIHVQPDLSDPHPLVKAAFRAYTRHREALEESRLAEEERKKPKPAGAKWQPNLSVFKRPRWDDYLRDGILVDMPADVLPLRVSLEQGERALRIWNALLHACSERKVRSTVADKRLRLSVYGEDVLLRISEKVRREEVTLKTQDSRPLSWMRPTQKSVGTGVLRIFVDEAMHSEEPEKPLEEQLNTIFVRIYRAAFASKERRVRFEEERRAARAAEERRAAERVIAEERRRLQQEELRRREQLGTEAGAWKQAQTIRTYVSHLRSEATGLTTGGGVPSELADWLSWAQEVADELDPTQERLNKQR